jgi:hypothetical protein
MIELLLTGFVAGMLAYAVMAALVDPAGSSLPALGF